MSKPLEKIDFKSGTWLTPDQFFAMIEGAKCCRCDNIATIFPKYKGNCYCDSHFPYGSPESVDAQRYSKAGL